METMRNKNESILDAIDRREEHKHCFHPTYDPCIPLAPNASDVVQKCCACTTTRTINKDNAMKRQ